ncbi:tetratricopeptide repeat protein [Sphingobacteriales bacterium UPWRP_1]|mgnify:CR=1 FL=1|nr:tetratricopeptide repeat protein [Sphingobacteriales bacterium TSM_CSS]PSJ76409.1 tetratricopeptide repeat protein [Sphingobacteriales bacterium UPWRP_1]
MSNSRLEKLQQFLEESPNDPFLHYAMALEYLKLPDDRKALDIFTQLTQTSPNYVGTYYHLGKLHEKLKQYNEALLTYKSGMEIARKLDDNHSYAELLSAYNALHDELSDW